MGFGSFDSGGDGEHNSVSLAEISRLFTMQDDIFNGTLPFDGVY